MKNYKNSYFSWNNNKIKDIQKDSKLDYLISSNIRMESAILNTKIRRKVISQIFDVISIGQHFNSSFPDKICKFKFKKF